jgi:hypothetical protein
MFVSSRIFLAVGAVLAALILAPATAAADQPSSCVVNWRTGKCSVSASGAVYVPPGAVLTGGSHRKSGRPICFDRHLNEGNPRYIVTCDGGDSGWWSNDLACWVKPAPAPPPTSDPVWEGRTDGAIYACQPATGGVTVGVPALRDVWLAAPPPQLVDPELLAFQALEVMALHRAGVGTTPSAGRTGVIGLPTYLWVTDPGPSVTGPQTRTASAGAVSVTGTARVLRMTWSLGNGRSITCRSAGTPYQDSFGSRPSPTCGYTYTTPGSYTIGLTTHWRFEWAGGGQSGSYDFTFTTPTAIRMQEVQALG